MEEVPLGQQIVWLNLEGLETNGPQSHLERNALNYYPQLAARDNMSAPSKNDHVGEERSDL